MNMTTRPIRSRNLCLLIALGILAGGWGAAAWANLAVGRTVLWQDTPGSGLEGSASANDSLAKAIVVGDFNGDGFDDLATFDRESAAFANAGAVRVQYSGGSGVTAASDLITDFFPPGGLSDAEPGDEFGAALAAGDFDGDGFEDLAIGVPFEDAIVGGVSYTNCGSIVVLLGSAGGILSEGWKLYPAQAGNKNEAQFGRALAAGDFNADGFDDLIVGSPGAEVSGQAQAGMLAVLNGGPVGFVSPYRLIHQDASDATGSVSDIAESGDHFGWSLAVGNWNGDTNGPLGPDVMDLAVGAPGEGDATAATSASGVVHLFYGAVAGTPLAFNTDQTINETDTATGQTLESGDSFGLALAAGDLTGDGRDDIAIAAPFEDVVSGSHNVIDAGMVVVVRGASPFVVASSGSVALTEDDLPVGEIPEVDDYFGIALAVGDADGDGFDDLAVGAPFEDVVDPITFHSVADAGAVSVVPGGPVGFPAPNRPPRMLAEGFGGHPGLLMQGDLYGSALALGHFDGDIHPDFLVGAPGEDADVEGETVADCGGLFVLPGSLFSDGFDFGNAGFWSDFHP
jgi:hypothetical protein